MGTLCAGGEDHLGGRGRGQRDGELLGLDSLRHGGGELDPGGSVVTRSEEPRVEHLGDPSPGPLHLESIEELLDISPVPSTHLEVEGVHVDRRVADQGHDGEVVPSQILVGGHVLSQLRRQLIEVGEDAIEIAIGGEQLRRRLLPHAGDPGQVVGAVAAHRRQHGVALRFETGALDNARLVIEVVVAHPSLVVEDPHKGVLNELEAVTVPCDHHDRATLVSGTSGQGGEHVVSLEVLAADQGDPETPDQIADHVELRQQIGWRLGPPSLVVLDHRVPERAARKVERDGERSRTMVAHDAQEHVREPVDGVRHQAV